MPKLEDLEARVAALEASRADYRAVLAAVNALGANQREQAIRLGGVETQLTGVEARLTTLQTRVENGFQETYARFGSVDEQLAEIKDLIIAGRDR
ncbi:hypothetical protein AU193_02135 [Mycobacterium sp. GA-1285]|uniref:hypothetical protein n=1 Tax=Mycobacterium sp. GA-1285 TaxID=1772282 RepID=UPI000747A352|nr:hypothetical protein [Mycobacterium sp. GA-1285]KUI11932.1 hypothetical protein AU193_02135 [Mycobacterium sp. GA-1285]